jgi:hypothetical protein
MTCSPPARRAVWSCGGRTSSTMRCCKAHMLLDWTLSTARLSLASPAISGKSQRSRRSVRESYAIAAPGPSDTRPAALTFSGSSIGEFGAPNLSASYPYTRQPRGPRRDGKLRAAR